ncbi:hypothetical protein DRQ33_01075, partial [bacterium]
GVASIFLAPILDLIILRKAFPMGYLNFKSFTDFIQAMFSLCITLPFFPMRKGLSPGLRIEIYLIILLIIIYTFIKTNRIWKSLLAGYLFYLTLFVPASITFINNHLSKLLLKISPTIFQGTGYLTATPTLVVIFFILLWIWIRILDRKILLSIVRGFRPIRFLFYAGMLIMGIWIGLEGNLFRLYYLNFFEILSLCIGFFGLWIFAVFINYYYDFAGDEVSGQKNPLTTNLLESARILQIAYIALLIGLLILGTQNGSVIKSAVLFVSFSYLYSAPPARLKRFPILATAILGLASLSGLLIGYSFVHNNIDKFPAGIAAATVICVALGFPAKDLKDIAGDMKTGTITIPTLFGYKNGKIICAILEMLALIFIPVLAGAKSMISISVAAIIAILIGGYTMFSKKFNENFSLGLTLLYCSIYAIFWHPF